MRTAKECLLLAILTAGLVTSSTAQNVAVETATPLPVRTSFAVTGGGYAGYDTAGSYAEGGTFSYRDDWEHFSDFLNVCTIGQPCGVYPMGLIEDWWPQGPSCLGMSCTEFRGGQVNLEGSFITPATTSEIQLEVPIRVSGNVTGRYEIGSSGPVHGGWPLWTVAFHGRGTAVLTMWGIGGNEVLIGYMTFSYTGKATAESSVFAIPTPGSEPTGLAFGGPYLYESEQGAFGIINQLDPSTGGVVRSFLSPSPTGFDGRSKPSDLVAADDHLFLTDVGTPGAGRVYEIDRGATTIFNSFSVPFRGGAIAADRARLFVADLDGSQILVTNHSGAAIRFLSTPFYPAGMVFDPKDNLLWLVDRSKELTISQITTKGALIRNCTGPWNPFGPGSWEPPTTTDGLGGISLRGSALYVAEVGGYKWEDPGPGTVSIVNSPTLTCSPPLPARARLDVMPNTFPNVLNVRNSGVLPAAVLSTAGFDATRIDPASIRFGDAGSEALPAKWALADVNHDGRTDLRLHFRIQETGIACDTTLVSIAGKTYGGMEIRGTDSVKVIPCR